MKVVILAGGNGLRLSEETRLRPKPLVKIGNKPIIWHVMMHYSWYGLRHFIIALGYRGRQIRQWARHLRSTEGPESTWHMDLVDTGLGTQTGGRLRRLGHLLDDTFMMTWSDGVSDLNLADLLAFHNSHQKLATVTAVRPPSRFGHLTLSGNRVTRFEEKPRLDDYWINGAFFVLEPGVLDYVQRDDMPWEREPMENLARDGELMAYLYDGFWQCMDTMYEKRLLEEMWLRGDAPWKIWD